MGWASDGALTHASALSPRRRQLLPALLYLASLSDRAPLTFMADEPANPDHDHDPDHAALAESAQDAAGLTVDSQGDGGVPGGPHDVGGFPAGPVDRSEHDTAHWEWQIDAMIRLALQKGLLSDFAELRDGIERLAPEDYDTLSYYERWVKSLAWVLVDKGVVSEAALERRAEAIRQRQVASA